MKKLLFILMLTAAAAQASLRTETFTYNVGSPIPDGLSLADVQNSPFTINNIFDMRVTLDVAGAPIGTGGGFNGDLYVQLSHGSGTSVLLNRPGRYLATPAFNPVGFDDGGLVFVFSDSAAVNAHDYRAPGAGTPGAQVTGTFQPDGRTQNPLLVNGDVDAPNPTASLLGAFGTENPNGNWNLLLVDNQFGTGNMALTSWTLSVTGIVPEPGTVALFAVIMGILPVVRRRRTRQA